MTNFYVFYLLSFIYRLSDSAVSEDAGIEPCWAVAESQSQSELIITTNHSSIDIHVVYCMQVCVPTLKTECVNDQVKDGLKLYQEEACYTVGYYHIL